MFAGGACRHPRSRSPTQRPDCDTVPLTLRAMILHPPAEYPQYNKGRGYYAVFFADPDSLKLECVYTPPPTVETST